MDAETVHQPDVLLRCGPRLPDETVVVPDPIILGEVLAPSTAGTDAGAKPEDYVRIPSVSHDLRLHPGRGTAIHHARDAEDGIRTRVLRGGRLAPDPPGLAVEATALVEDDPPT